MNSVEIEKFVDRSPFIKVVLALTLTLPLWSSGVVHGDEGDSDSPGSTSGFEETVFTSKREARRIERRQRQAAEPRFRGEVNGGTSRNNEVIVDLGKAPTAQDVIDALSDSIEVSETEDAQRCIESGISNGTAAGAEDCLNGVVQDSLGDAQGAAEDAVMDAVGEMVRTGTAVVHRVGAGATYRIARNFPLYASVSAEAGISRGANRPVFITESDTSLQVGRSGDKLRDVRLAVHPVNYGAGPSAPRELSFLGLEAGIGNLNAKFEPFYCPQLPVGEQEEHSVQSCMRRYSGELGTSEDSLFSVGLAGGYAGSGDDPRWLADGKARATAQVRVKGVGIQVEGYAGITTGVDGQEIYAASTVGANLTITSRARRGE